MSGGHSLHAAASGGDVARIRSILTTPRSYTAGLTSFLLHRSTNVLRQSTTTSSSSPGAANQNSPTTTGNNGVVDVNELDSAGCTPLQRAAAEGHEEIIRLLLAHGADVNRKDSVHGNTALHEAAWKGYSRTVAILAAAGANLETANNGGFAPLHLCCQNGHNQSCRELLLAGCNPDLQNNYGDTPLHTSARYGHAGVTRILISAQCRVSDQNKNDDTALHIAAAMGRRKLTRILLEAGCDKHLRNKQGETAKDIATRKDLNEIIHIINTTKSLVKKKSSTTDKKSSRNKNDVTDGSRCTKDKHHKDKKSSKSKVRFESLNKHWSPYGCHYYPDPKSFPKPKLDTLPIEPLRKGEQYYLDLAGNICKGPIGVGYTCYCAPFFKHMEERLDRDKQELKAHIDKAHERLDHKVTNLELKTQGQISELTRCVAAERALCDKRHQHLEQWLLRSRFGRQSERVRKVEHSPPYEYGSQEILQRSKSLELLDDFDDFQNRSGKQNSRSMELLDDTINHDVPNRVRTILPEQHFQFKSQVMKETTANQRYKPQFVQQIVTVDHHANEEPSSTPRKTVSELVKEIQMHQRSGNIDQSSPQSVYNSSVINNRTELHIPINDNTNGDQSESSDDEEDQNYPNTSRHYTKNDDNIHSNYENVNQNYYNDNNPMFNEARTRVVFYSPTSPTDMLINSSDNPTHINVQDPYDIKNTGLYVLDDHSSPSHDRYNQSLPQPPPTIIQHVNTTLLDNTNNNHLGDFHHPMTASSYHHHRFTNSRKPIDLQMLEKDVHSRIANLHMLDRDLKKDINVIEHNDSGYSTKVYGSSQGNSPSLSGEVENINNGKTLPSPPSTSSPLGQNRSTSSTNNILPGSSSLV
ncbi:uncharacterized protein LOC123300563 [Chrysoperla carnea]|uniref:uncharacterized protein LOC123300563 n=1 Tax=Chrysoperla carnea TaxID=189513 RepID=UPI001D05CCD1|nr:uncharacterized protein LOC123300563 [Chrysoperla carnea]